MERGKLSREIAISRALKITQEKGINKLTYNGLARSLGIQPQSLYRYLKNITDVKSEVIAAIINTWKKDIDIKLQHYSGKEYLKQFAIYFFNTQEDILSTEILTSLSKYSKIKCVQEALNELRTLPVNMIKSLTRDKTNISSNTSLYINYLIGSALTMSIQNIHPSKKIYLNNIDKILSLIN